MTAPALAWCDIESSSLDEFSGALLEVGFRITDAHLDTLAEASWVIPWRTGSLEAIRGSADQTVRAMHDANGLWRECDAIDLGYSIYDATLRGVRQAVAKSQLARDITAWLTDHGAAGLPLAGSTVGFDRRWLRAWMPDVEVVAHYRSLDVSAWKVGLQTAAVHGVRLAQDALDAAPGKSGAHRVLADIDASIAEFRAYCGVLGLSAVEVAA